MYTPFPILYDYDLESKTENFWKYGSHIATGTVYTHSVYTIPFLYDYDLDPKTENFWKNGSNIATGTVYTHSVYTVPVNMWLWFWTEKRKF